MKNHKSIVLTVLLALGSLTVLFPLYMTILIAFKSNQETAKSLFALPTMIHWENFAKAIKITNFFQAFRNSAVITVSTDCNHLPSQLVKCDWDRLDETDVDKKVEGNAINNVEEDQTIRIVEFELGCHFNNWQHDDWKRNEQGADEIKIEEFEELAFVHVTRDRIRNHGIR